MLGWITAAAAAAGVVTAGYHTMAPRSQLYGRTFIRGAGPNTIALTFDDGPNDPHTLRLLDVLAQHQAKATFFLIGAYVRRRPDIVRAIAAAGHEIGNHTFSHPNLIFRSPAQTLREIEDCDRAIEDAAGRPTRLFRPPHGGRTPGVLRAVRHAGKLPILWSVAGWDWRPHTAEEISATVRRQVRGGDVVLLHDGSHLQMGADRGASVAAAGLLLRHYGELGWKFLTVGEMV